MCVWQNPHTYHCTTQVNEKKMCLCLLQKVHNPPVQRIHKGKTKPKSPWERNAGKGGERERNRSHLPSRGAMPGGRGALLAKYASAWRWLSPSVGAPAPPPRGGEPASPPGEEKLPSPGEAPLPGPLLLPPAPVPATYQPPPSVQAGAAPPAAASASRGGSK